MREILIFWKCPLGFEGNASTTHRPWHIMTLTISLNYIKTVVIFNFMSFN
jgi:hypothetical protein